MSPAIQPPLLLDPVLVHAASAAEFPPSPPLSPPDRRTSPRLAMAAAALRAQLNAHIAGMYTEVRPLPSPLVVWLWNLA